MGRHDFIRLGVILFAQGPRQADLMVVSGTVSDKMAPAVKRLYEQMPEPKYVISFGACSNCGGPRPASRKGAAVPRRWRPPRQIEDPARDRPTSSRRDGGAAPP